MVYAIALSFVCVCRRGRSVDCVPGRGLDATAVAYQAGRKNCLHRCLSQISRAIVRALGLQILTSSVTGDCDKDKGVKKDHKDDAVE